MPNRELAARILAEIEAHPEMHEQGTWRTVRPSCGTTMCVAGWACHLSGDEFHGGHAGFEFTDFDEVRRPNGAIHSVLSAAAEHLELDSWAAEDLFYRGKAGALRALRAIVAGDPNWLELPANDDDEASQ